MAATTSPALKLPTAGGPLESYTPRKAVAFAAPDRSLPFTRIAYSAAHVVADPRAATDPWLEATLDWDATIAYRQRLWSLGLGVAEAMDTAQRGMGLDWPTSLELIRRSLDAARDYPGALVASGCGTDHLVADASTTVDDVIAAYEEQMAAIERHGGRLIVMASRALAKVAKSPADYERVYDRVLMQAKQPVILHWLGDMFDPALAGYWGSSDVDAAMTTALGVIAANPGKVDGIKISLLDKGKEIAMRRRLPEGVRMYTGDDFNYAELIAGDGTGAAMQPAAQRRLARHLRRHRAGRQCGVGQARRRRPRGLPRHPRADGAALAPHLQGADPLLQDRHRLPGLAQRPPVALHDGGRPAERTLDAALRRSLQARRCGRAARATRARHGAHAPAAGAAWHRGLIARAQQRLPDLNKPMRDFSADHRWLSINTATLRGAGGLDTIIDACARHGIRAISPWRDQVAAVGLGRVARIVRAHGLALSGYCRGGMYTGHDAAGRIAALDDNRRAVDEAKTLDAACVVLVVGGVVGAADAALSSGPLAKDLVAARNDVRDGIAATLEYARSVGMPLAIEPLHPMYAADRACVNTLEQALDLCDALDPGGATGATGAEPAALGVAVDVYHVWWDPKVEAQIARAGARRLLGFHVCDWLVPTRDMLSDRGMMGDGVIDIPRLRGCVEAAGFAGYSEVEIFSAEDWWKQPADLVLETCIERHRTVV